MKQADEGRVFPDLVGPLGTWRAPLTLRRAAVAMIFLVAYVALERLSYLHEYKGVPITPWNPALGMMFALIVLAGPMAGALLAAGVVVAEILVLQSALEWPFILGIAIVIAVSYSAAAFAARAWLRLDPTLTHLRDVLALLAAGVGAAAVVATLISGLLIAGGKLAANDVLSAAAPLFVGDVIGVAVTTPLLLRLAFHRRDPLNLGSAAFYAEFIAYVAFILVSEWAIVSRVAPDGFKFFYVLFLPIVAAALRFGVDGACLALAAAQFGLVGLLQYYGYGARAFTEFQTLMLILTATGLIVGVVVSERENADRRARRAEGRLREREAEAAQAERFNLVSSMATALAHEINQPMTAARALGRSAQHIVSSPDGDLSRAQANLGAMIAQIDHAGAVVRRMRGFLRRGKLQISTIDVKEMLADALSLSRAQGAAGRMRIDLDVDEDTPLIHGDRVQLQQVVINLVGNAVEAIAAAGEADGRVRVAARRSGGGVEIAVADNGPGVAAEVAQRLFEPLTTSKQQGLGLGLSICASIVESHGGRIRLHSGERGATEFRVSLPIEPSSRY